jgi:hypothetical protein
MVGISGEESRCGGTGKKHSSFKSKRRRWMLGKEKIYPGPGSMGVGKERNLDPQVCSVSAGR